MIYQTRYDKLLAIYEKFDIISGCLASIGKLAVEADCELDIEGLAKTEAEMCQARSLIHEVMEALVANLEPTP